MGARHISRRMAGCIDRGPQQQCQNDVDVVTSHKSHNYEMAMELLHVHKLHHVCDDTCPFSGCSCSQLSVIRCRWICRYLLEKDVYVEWSLLEGFLWKTNNFWQSIYHWVTINEVWMSQVFFSFVLTQVVIVSPSVRMLTVSRHGHCKQLKCYCPVLSAFIIPHILPSNHVGRKLCTASHPIDEIRSSLLKYKSNGFKEWCTGENCSRFSLTALKLICKSSVHKPLKRCYRITSYARIHS